MSDFILNETILEDVFYIVTFLIAACVIHDFFNSCLGCKIKKPVYIVLIYSLYVVIFGTIYYLPIIGYSKLLLNCVLVIGLSFLYEKSCIWRFSASAFILALILLSDIISQSLLLTFVGGNDTGIYILSLVLGKILLLVMVNISVHLFTSFGKGLLSVWYWFAIILCPIMSCAAIYGLVRYPFDPLLFLPVSLGLVFANYFVFSICENILSKQNANNRALLLEQQIEHYTNQYALAEQAQKETVKFRHDIKNILVGLQGEVDSGEITGSKNTLTSLIENFNSQNGIVHSGNLVIDTIINYKQGIAIDQGITFVLDLRIPGNIILDTTAISVILGNALDNAIEACQKVQEQKYIKIELHYENESLYIRIENPYQGSIRTDFNGKILSQKSNRKHHGIGLNSMHETIGKQNGLLTTKYDNNIFQIEIVLFGIKRVGKKS